MSAEGPESQDERSLDVEHEPNANPERLRRPERATEPQADGADRPLEEYVGYHETDEEAADEGDREGAAEARREADLQPGPDDTK